MSHTRPARGAERNWNNWVGMGQSYLRWLGITASQRCSGGWVKAACTNGMARAEGLCAPLADSDAQPARMAGGMHK